MNEDNKKTSKNEERSFQVQRFLRKRWLVPAIYLVAAAGILSSALYFMQGQDEIVAPDDGSIEVEENQFGSTGLGEDAVPVASGSEVIKLPVADENEVNIVGSFYDVNGTPEEQQSALVYYNNYYYQNKGIDLAKDGEESFDVTASLSGTIVKAEKDSLLGYVVEIDHDNGIVTHYHSLGELNVEEGETVRQGDVLGTAGRSLYNEDAGVHAHFEIRQNGLALNPEEVLHQTIQSLAELSFDEEPNNVTDQDTEKAEEPQEGEKEAADEQEKPVDEEKDQTDKPANEDESADDQAGDEEEINESA
ncbi:M23 family metallopeptidase [Halalkalibacterium ligniniphilum]|uniref:M23 family metallopeptidase n=1 Tax=Halalkalibacterium ligniniphilum TaxID=1134413 RepID=UPI00034D210D|nr:M23 family metallopeptidase [Halalkalibacterium ligniniphilum]